MDPKIFYVGIKGIIVKDNKALILEKIDQQGKRFWDIPGGRIGEEEEVTDTLRRELLEEVPSISNIRIKDLLNVYRLDRNLKDENGLLLVFYKVEADLSKVTISSEHLSYKWVTKDEVEKLNQEAEPYITAGVNEALMLALSRK